MYDVSVGGWVVGGDERHDGLCEARLIFGIVTRFGVIRRYSHTSTGGGQCSCPFCSSLLSLQFETSTRLRRTLPFGRMTNHVNGRWRSATDVHDGRALYTFSTRLRLVVALL
jgi:hypothetical protein